MAVMTTTAQQVVNEIEEYMRPFGGYYSDWYVGVASDPRQRLFVDHRVREKDTIVNGVRQPCDAWIFRECKDDAAARSVEDYFLGKGCDGGPGGGDRSTRHVYAYRKARHTNP